MIKFELFSDSQTTPDLACWPGFNFQITHCHLLRIFRVDITLGTCSKGTFNCRLDRHEQRRTGSRELNDWQAAVCDY